MFNLDDASRPNSSTFDDEFVGGVARAAGELGIAVRWLRANDAEYCIDPDAIVAAGYSWGAITALSLTYSSVSSRAMAW